MLTCPNCGGENRFGAIFCRVCGKKLEMIDKLTVDTFQEQAGVKKKKRKKSELPPKELRKKSIIKNAIRIAIILLVAFAVYLTQKTPPVSAVSTSEASRKTFLGKKKALQDAVKGNRSDEAVVTEKELNSYIAGLVPEIEKGKVVRVENIQVDLGSEEDEGRIAVRIYVRVFGKKMLFQLFGNLKKSNGNMKFSPTFFARVGQLPYPALLMKLHCRNLLKNMTSDTDLFKKLTEAKVRQVKLRGGKTTPGIELKVGGKS